jgi:long-chain acyl-CoA synthetase
MSCVERTYEAPPRSGEVILGRTLPSLLDEACDTTPNEHAFHQWAETEWQPLSNQAFRSITEALAVGLLDLGLEKGDRVAFLMHSDLNFCLADMACLLTGLVNVPIDLTQTLEHIIFVLQHSEAKALIISNVELLTQIAPYLSKAPLLQRVIVVEAPSGWQRSQLPWATPPGKTADDRALAGNVIPQSACLAIPMALHPVHADQSVAAVPQCIQVLALETVKQQGQSKVSIDRLQQLRAALQPHDLATIIYIPDEMGQMQGVTLSHENLSANAIASFSGITNLKHGDQEIVLSFLPLNHVLARVMLYGHIHYGHCIYFSNPNRVIKHLKDVRPTVLVTVPLFLEKIYGKLLEKSKRSPQIIVREKNYSDGIGTGASSPFLFSLVVSLRNQLRFLRALMSSLQVWCTQLLINWALKLAQRYELGQPPHGLYALLLKVVDRFVFSRWRATFGDRLRYLICGGAPLKAEIVNAFAAADVVIFQGYGLTQASAVVCCNRGSWNRAGTVGVPIAGVEVAIADDNEILVRAPYVTPGYYKNPAMTQEAIDADGWLHTGDLGTFTAEGYLKIIGLKKALFKLSTGKYIAPQPIEQRLKRSSFVAQAITVGSEQKFCAVLIVPNLDALHVQALENGIDASPETLLQHPSILALYQAVVDAANCHLPYWAIVKRFRLINATFSVENGLLTPAGQVNRTHAIATFAADIAALYQDDLGRRVNERDATSAPLVSVSAADCPAFAQSLNPRLTT